MTTTANNDCVPALTCIKASGIDTRHALFAGVALLTLLAGGTSAMAAPATPVPADQGDARGDTTPEITVTAKQRLTFQSAQKVPDSITRISGQELVERGVKAVTDLPQLAPSLVIKSTNGGGAVDYYLRGVGMKDFTQNNTPSILAYVDGVAYPSAFSLTGSFFDLSSVDVTAGPVGFTHGLPDTGGEVNLHTADPTDHLSIGVNEDYASYGRNKASAYISGPITDTLAFRLAGQSIQGGAWQYRPTDGTKLGASDLTALRGKLRWQPDTATTLLVGGYLTIDHSQLTMEQPKANLIPSLAVSTTQTQRQAQWSCNPAFAQLAQIGGCRVPSMDNTIGGLNAKLTHQFDGFKVESLTAWDRTKVREFSDQDGSQYDSDDSFRYLDIKSISQQLIVSSDADKRLTWSLGGYWNKTALDVRFFYDFAANPSNYMAQTTYGQRSTSFSQFANLAFKLTPRLTLRAAGSHQYDGRQLNGLHTTQYVGNNPSLIKADYPFGNVATQSSTWNWSGGIDWQARDNLLIYGKISRSNRPGGFTANNTTTIFQLAPYLPEQLTTYEAGFKSDIIPGRLRLNLAAFHNDYINQVYLGSYVTTNRSTGLYVNIPKSDSNGVEGTLEVQPVKDLWIKQNFGYQKGTFQQFFAINTAAVTAFFAKNGYYTAIGSDFSGYDNGSPHLTLNGSADYTLHAVKNYDLNLGGDWSYMDSQLITPGGTGFFKLPSYTILGAHLTIRPKQGRWSATVYSTNITNKVYYPSGNNASPATNWLPGEPRFVGVRFAYAY